MGRGTSPKGKSKGGGGGFKKFTDVAYGGWEYGGSGADTVAFFKDNSNYDDLMSQMSPEELYAFKRWTEGHFMHGQQYGGFDNMSSEDQEKTRIYDKYLDQATLNEGIEVRRLATAELVMGAGKKHATLDELQAMQGSIVTSKGCMSTAAAAEGLSIGSFTKDVEYVISIPKGSKGAGMWVGDSRINSWGPDQREFMMNRDTAYTVGKTTYNKTRGVYEVELIYSGLLAHDYGSVGA